jgi:hypothetical protein
LRFLQLQATHLFVHSVARRFGVSPCVDVSDKKTNAMLVTPGSDKRREVRVENAGATFAADIVVLAD